MKEMKARVKKALKVVRPSLLRDGGDVELIDVTPEGIVKVKLIGACSECSRSDITLTQGIEYVIKKAVLEIKRVEEVKV